MANKKADVECYPISFTLNIKNTVEPQPVETFPVKTTSGQTLLQALQQYQNTNANFCFETQNAPTSGPYVVAVMRQRKGPNLFWETLLYNEASTDVIPIDLSYQVRNDDNVYLRFSFF